MNDLRLSTLAHQVVAWHNRHPLARRIGVQHVQAMGYVVMPFVGPEGAPPGAAARAPGPADAHADANTSSDADTGVT